MNELLFWIALIYALGWAIKHHDDDIKGGE
jgi:hypothetical protein